MTRSYDRRAVPPSHLDPALIVRKCDRIKAEKIVAGMHIEKEEPVSLELDCMCEKNDPNCAECWELPGRNTSKPNKPFLDEFDRDVRYRFDECLELLLRKHLAYGPSNIGNAPGGPLNGLQVRMHDKLARINNLIATGHQPDSEPLRDSFLDLANYSVIALMVLDGVWPSE